MSTRPFRFLVAVLVFAAIGQVQSAQEEVASEKLIGWGGESYRPKDKVGNRTGAPTKRWIETLSWNPRAFVFHGFMTHEEADHMIELVKPSVARSMVVDSKTGQSKLDPIRTSYGGAIGRGADPVIAAIEERIAEWTRVPADHGEPIQVLKYMDGQKYDAHWDWFDDPVHHSAYLREGNRLATVLMYLADVEEGGETTLPLAKPINAVAQAQPGLSQCGAKGAMAIKPNKGDALLFWDLKLDGQTGDRAALHASCPTLAGTKWTATKWIHNKVYGGSFDALEQASKCHDIATSCEELTKAGACTKPSSNLVGPAGVCRRTCGDCIDCPHGDIICQRGNLKGLVRRKPGGMT